MRTPGRRNTASRRRERRRRTCQAGDGRSSRAAPCMHADAAHPCIVARTGGGHWIDGPPVREGTRCWTGGLIGPALSGPTGVKGIGWGPARSIQFLHPSVWLLLLLVQFTARVLTGGSREAGDRTSVVLVILPPCGRGRSWACLFFFFFLFQLLSTDHLMEIWNVCSKKICIRILAWSFIMG